MIGLQFAHQENNRVRIRIPFCSTLEPELPHTVPGKMGEFSMILHVTQSDPLWWLCLAAYRASTGAYGDTDERRLCGCHSLGPPGSVSPLADGWPCSRSFISLNLILLTQKTENISPVLSHPQGCSKDKIYTILFRTHDD